MIIIFLNSINQQGTIKGAHQITNLNLFDNKETFSTWFGDSVDSEDKKLFFAYS